MNRTSLERWAGRLPRGRTLGLALLAAVLSLGLFVSTASATVMKYLDLAKLIEYSDKIVHAEVVQQKTYKDEEQGRIVTDTTLRVKETFLGDHAEEVTLQQWGGELDGQVAHVPGDAKFSPEEEVIVFLHRNSDDEPWALSALRQAKYKVIRNGKQTMVFRNLKNIAFLQDDGSSMKTLTGETRSLASFRAELKALVAGIKGGDQ